MHKTSQRKHIQSGKRIHTGKSSHAYDSGDERYDDAHVSATYLPSLSMGHLRVNRTTLEGEGG